MKVSHMCCILETSFYTVIILNYIIAINKHILYYILKSRSNIGGKGMIKNLTKKHILFVVKMMLVFLILCISSIFFFGQGSYAVQKSGGDYILESKNSDGVDSIDNKSVQTASVNYTPKSTNKPTEANVILIPKETDTDSDTPSQLPAVNDNDKETIEKTDSVKQDNTDDIDEMACFETIKDIEDKEGVHTADSLQTIKGKQPLVDTQETQNTQDTQNNHYVPSKIMLLQTQLNNIYSYKGERIAYLTFDDGPTPYLTEAILDILKEEEIKATFFPIGSNAERYPDLIRRQYEEGHGIGNHTYSHVFKHIYGSLDNYVNELILTEQILQSILGYNKEFKLTRFPGGSFGKALAPYREAVNEAGYLYIDWNSLNGDAETTKKRTREQLVKRLKETVKGQSGLIVLMHDAPNKETTVEALSEIIQYLKSENYRFELLPGSR